MAAFSRQDQPSSAGDDRQMGWGEWNSGSSAYDVSRGQASAGACSALLGFPLLWRWRGGGTSINRPDTLKVRRAGFEFPDGLQLDKRWGPELENKKKENLRFPIGCRKVKYINHMRRH